MDRAFKVDLLENHMLRFQLADGNVLYSPSDEDAYEIFFTVYNSVYMLDQYMARQRINKGNIVLDCGAHIGTFSLLASQLDAFVIAVEPLKINLSCLELLIARYGNICMAPGVVYDCNQQILFTLKDSRSTASGRVTEDGEAVVRAMTIDTIADRLGLASIDFIKMDTEGSEYNAIVGADKVLKEFGPELAITAYHRENDTQRLRELILSIRDDYNLFISRNHPFAELMIYGSTIRSKDELRELFEIQRNQG